MTLKAHLLRIHENVMSAALQKFGRNRSSVSHPDQLDVGPQETDRASKFIQQAHPVGSVDRGEFVDSKINCLKILALSLLREIASVEKLGEGQGNDTIDLHAEVRRFEEELIRSALIQTGGRQRPAARLLRTKTTTLNTKIKRYKINLAQISHLD